MASAYNVYDGILNPVPNSFVALTMSTAAQTIPGLAALLAAGPLYVAQITISGQANGIVRYRDDGVAPTSTVGMPYFVGASFTLPLSSFANCQWILDSSTTTAVVNIAFY